MGQVIPDAILPAYRQMFGAIYNVDEENYKDLTVEQMLAIIDAKGIARNDDE